MTTYFHTPIAYNADADSAVVNAPIAQLDEAVSKQGGGTAARTNYLLAHWAAALERLNGAPTAHGTYPDLIGSANVIWPDGSAGAYTVTAVDANWIVVTGFTLTHAQSGRTLTYSGLVLNSTTGFITTPATFSVS